MERALFAVRRGSGWRALRVLIVGDVCVALCLHVVRVGGSLSPSLPPSFCFLVSWFSLSLSLSTEERADGRAWRGSLASDAPLDLFLRRGLTGGRGTLRINTVASRDTDHTDSRQIPLAWSSARVGAGCTVQVYWVVSRGPRAPRRLWGSDLQEASTARRREWPKGTSTEENLPLVAHLWTTAPAELWRPSFGY